MLGSGARSGKAEGLPYSLSRWTDLPAAKWPWFEQQLAQGWMVGFDPRTAFPAKWSLAVEDTLGLVFWTRNPTNLIERASLLKPYPLVVHMTLTGWHEVEKGSPSIEQGLRLMEAAVDAFGPENVVWRFSPVPMTDDTVKRFNRIASAASTFGVRQVYVAFLQDNDLMTEDRDPATRREVLRAMADGSHGLDVLLCQEDKTLQAGGDLGLRHPPNLRYGVCEDGKRFPQGSSDLAFEGCGCALAVDPFTVNESCTMGCRYCYAADQSLASRKRNTTRSLPVMR